MTVRLGIAAASLTVALTVCAAAAAPRPPVQSSRNRAGETAVASAPRSSGGSWRRVVLLGLRQRGHLGRFVSRVSRPSSPSYRQFVDLKQFRRRYSAAPRDRRRVVRYLRRRRGVRTVEVNSTRTVVLGVMTAATARRTFCATGSDPPTHGLCVPRRLRRSVGPISAGERYQNAGGSSAKRAPAARARGTNGGTPKGCPAAVKTGGFTPNQLATAYGVDPLHAQGLSGQGLRVATLASQPIAGIGLGTWARCFKLPEPNARLVTMPSANPSTALPGGNEEALDIEALASLAPGLERITPIFVPLDKNGDFGHSFALFMFGVLDRSRQHQHLPDILSISDGGCEGTFTNAQLRLGQRMLREASALGITALAAAGDSGFLACQGAGTGASFPDSSRYVTGVGGTQLTLNRRNRIADQVVWSTFATKGSNGAGTGGGPSALWMRPGFQRARGIGAALQRGRRTRLTPDVAAMASEDPGIVTYNRGIGGWGTDSGTSAATPLIAAIVALVDEQEHRAGRPLLGSIPPLLYRLARGSGYHSIFYDVTKGTSSRKPHSRIGQTPAGGAAQPGYDLATGLGSIDASTLADALARNAARRR
jgi:subtilase family serine protease